jgi:5-formyltetrahydrofolate cyclo-ligase
MNQVDKEKLRTVYLRKRKMLTPNEQEKRNAKLFYLFSQFLEEHDVKTVHTFLSIQEQNEVDTWVIVKYLKALDYNVVISKCNTEKNELTHFRFENKRQLQKNKWGIYEPVSGEEVSSQALDMVLVPLIVNDKKGHRIGYGKGYYDRFISECPA